MEINLEKLLVMQYGVRSIGQIPAMARYVSQGGVWTLEAIKAYSEPLGLRSAPIIELVRFPDDRLMIHDGHHRCIGTWLGGRKTLFENEFKIVNWRYEDYMEINHLNRWVTPFDPRIHLRAADIFSFKNKALELFKESKEEAISYIKANKHLYLIDRTIHYLPELAEQCSSLIIRQKIEI